MFNAGVVLGAGVNKQNVNFDLPLSDSVRGKSTVDGLTVEVVQFEKDHWLSSELNVIVLRLTEPAFGARAEPTSPRPSAPPCKRRWPNTPPR